MDDVAAPNDNAPILKNAMPTFLIADDDFGIDLYASRHDDSFL